MMEMPSLVSSPYSGRSIQVIVTPLSATIDAFKEIARYLKITLDSSKLKLVIYKGTATPRVSVDPGKTFVSSIDCLEAITDKDTTSVVVKLQSKPLEDLHSKWDSSPYCPLMVLSTNVKFDISLKARLEEYNYRLRAIPHLCILSGEVAQEITDGFQ